MAQGYRFIASHGMLGSKVKPLRKKCVAISYAAWVLIGGRGAADPRVGTHGDRL